MTSYAQNIKHVEESLNPGGYGEIRCLDYLIRLTEPFQTPRVERNARALRAWASRRAPPRRPCRLGGGRGLAPPRRHWSVPWGHTIPATTRVNSCVVGFLSFLRKGGAGGGQGNSLLVKRSGQNRCGLCYPWPDTHVPTRWQGDKTLAINLYRRILYHFRRIFVSYLLKPPVVTPGRARYAIGHGPGP